VDDLLRLQLTSKCRRHQPKKVVLSQYPQFVWTYRSVNVAPASILRVRASVLAPTQTAALAAGHWALVTKVRCGNVVLLEVSIVETSLSLEIDDR